MKKTALFLLLINLIFTNCQTVVDIDIPIENPQLALNATLVNGARIGVHLSESQHILDGTEFQNINDAEVKIYENGEFLTHLFEKELGFYYSDSLTQVKAGNTYRVEVSKNGFQSVDAECRVPQNPAKIINTTLDTAEVNEFGYSERVLEFDIEIEDEAGVANFYELVITEEAYVYYYDYNTNPPTIVDSSMFINPLYLESKDPSLEGYQSFGKSVIFDDGLFDGKKYHLKVTSSYYPDLSGDTKNQPKYIVILRNTSKSYYLYQQSVKLYYWVDEDPFAQPVQIYNNINNGFGIFSSYNDKMQTEVKVGG
jgi:hypothetical protein